MRALWLPWATLAMCLAVPAWAAQTTEVVTDPAGDVSAEAAGVGAGDPAGMQALDLLALQITETPDDLVFGVALADVSGDRSTGLVVAVSMRIEDTPYLVEMFLPAEAFKATLGAHPAGQLLRGGGEGGRLDWVAWLEPEVDEAAGEVRVHVARQLLLDSRGAAPFPGMRIDGFSAVSATMDTQGWSLRFGPVQQDAPRVRYADAMPDVGNATLPLPISYGIAQSGHARLAAHTPMRASNGEANTFLFEVDARNDGPEDDEFTLATVGVPSTWQVQLPIDALRLEAGTNRTVPVVVTTPFAHQHGTAQTFVLEMRSIHDPGTVGRTALGIRYNAIPQPAGHHDTVWFHSVRREANLFTPVNAAILGYDPALSLVMNAQETFDGATGEPVPGQRDGTRISTDGTDFGFVTWLVPLSPSLDMGLDFDMRRTGVLSVPVSTVLPVPGARLEGRILHVVGADERWGTQGLLYGEAESRVQVARLSAAGPVDLAPSSTTVFEVDVVPQVDVVHFAKGAQLVLQVNLTYVRPELPWGPMDVPTIPGGSMRLPLLEYRDPVAGAYSWVGDLAIHADSPQDRLLNPGDVALYRFRLMDHGAAAGPYLLTVTGPNAHWARLLDGDGVHLPPGGVAHVAVAVEAPEDAPDGAVANLVLRAVHAKDPDMGAMARLAAQVDRTAQHPDDAAAVAGWGQDGTSRQSPLAPAAALLVAMGAVAWSARRRR